MKNYLNFKACKTDPWTKNNIFATFSSRKLRL